MTRRLTDITDRMQAIGAELREIEERNTGGDAAADPADVERVDQLLAEHDRLEAERSALVAERAQREANIFAAAGRTGTSERVAAEVQLMRRVDPRDPTAALRSRGLAAVERAEDVPDSARAAVADLIDRGDAGSDAAAQWAVASSDPAYLRAFLRFMRDPEFGHREFSADEVTAWRAAREVQRGLLLSPDSAGGALVPIALDPTIILTNTGAVDPLRQLATTVLTATDSWNGVTSAGITAEWTAEVAVWADATPTVGAQGIPVHKADAWVKGSYEVLADSNFVAQLPRLLADAKMRLEAAAFATGDGANKPTGIVTAAVAITTSRVASVTNGTWSTVDIYNVADAVRPRDQDRMSWLANLGTVNRARQFETANGALQFPELRNTQPTLLGRRVHEASSIDRYVGTTSSLWLAGDISAYHIVDRVGMVVRPVPVVLDTTSGRPTGEAGYAAFWRVGAGLPDPAAIRVFRATSTTSGWA